MKVFCKADPSFRKQSIKYPKLIDQLVKYDLFKQLNYSILQTAWSYIFPIYFK